MARKIARLFITVFGIKIGVTIIYSINEAMLNLGTGMSEVFEAWAVVAIYIAAGTVFGLISYFIAPKLVEGFKAAINAIDHRLGEMPLSVMFFGVVGLTVGLLIALLVSTLISGLTFRWLTVVINVLLYTGLGYLGWTIMIRRRNEINPPTWLKRGGKGKTNIYATPKLLDTSSIIDGRIFDICRTGIVEGTIIVPEFVLQELRHIADSQDALKRNRGRRGLDILKRMQDELEIPIYITQCDYNDTDEVDSKLIRLAHSMGGAVVTTDYNLNKVAGVQNVPVLNINDLSNAIKSVVLPGEDIFVSIIKEGKELNQGVAYLDDGTMIVIENGKKHIGEDLSVVVTSVLQTSAGRMIFAKVKSAE